MQLAVGRLHRVARHAQRPGQRARGGQGRPASSAPSRISWRTARWMRACSGRAPWAGSPTQALTDSSCACLNTIGLDLCEKWWGTASHSRTINPDIDSCRLRRIQEPHSGHVFRPSAFPARWSDLAHPVVAGLISVIVNYGGTFILVFQAAKAAGLSPELTASWVWSVSIGVGVTGLVLSWPRASPSSPPGRPRPPPSW